MRRRNSAFRRRTNTYAKTVPGLQRTLDVYWVIHNFVRKHWTTGQVPAVAMGVLRLYWYRLKAFFSGKTSESGVQDSKDAEIQNES